MKRIIIITFLIQFFIVGCKLDTFDMYRETINEILSPASQSNSSQNFNDVNDLRGCQVLVALGEWEVDGRRQSWIRGSMITEKGVSLDLPIFSDITNRGWKNLVMILSDPSLHPIYIGPWHPIYLTESIPFSVFIWYRINRTKYYEKLQAYKEKYGIKKLIRFFAYTDKNGGHINYQYESQTEENKNIPEREFSLPRNFKIAPKLFSLCVVKWTAKYGYNAIAEVKSKNQYSKDYLVPTGKIIEAKE